MGGVLVAKGAVVGAVVGSRLLGMGLGGARGVADAVCCSGRLYVWWCCAGGVVSKASNPCGALNLLIGVVGVKVAISAGCSMSWGGPP